MLGQRRRVTVAGASVVAPTAPTLTAPTANGVLVGTGYTVSATVTAGQVPDRVDFVLDPGGSEVVVATDSASPYSQTWTVAGTTTIGEHTLVARFVYGSGSVDSTALPIVVFPAGTALALLGDYVSKTVNAVDTWTDLSGNGRDFAPFAGRNPAYQATGGPNSQPDVRFDAAKSVENTGSPFASLTAADVFVVLKMDNATMQGGTTNGLWAMGTEASPPDEYYGYSTGNIYEDAGSTTRRDAITHTQDLTAWHVLRVTSTSSEYTINVGTQQIYTNATNTVGFPTSCALGASAAGNAPARNMIGNIACLLVLDHKATTGELAAIKAFFATKYGALPGTA